jgi:hypothetical protein
MLAWRRLLTTFLMALVTTVLMVASPGSQDATAKFKPTPDGITDLWVVAPDEDTAGSGGPTSRSPALAEEPAARYGGTIGQVWRYALNGFSVRMSAS